MENYISKQTSYDVAYEVAQKAKKVLGLSEYDRETLEHDINNLRAHEWIDLFNMIPDSNEVKKLYFTHCVELEDENEQELDESMNTFTTVRTRLKENLTKGEIQEIVNHIVDRMDSNLRDTDDKTTDIEFEISTTSKKEISKIFNLLNDMCSDKYIDYEIEAEQVYPGGKYYYAVLNRKYPDDYYFDYEDEETLWDAQPGQRTGKYKTSDKSLKKSHNDQELKENMSNKVDESLNSRWKKMFGEPYKDSMSKATSQQLDDLKKKLLDKDKETEEKQNLKESAQEMQFADVPVEQDPQVEAPKETGYGLAIFQNGKYVQGKVFKDAKEAQNAFTKISNSKSGNGTAVFVGIRPDRTIGLMAELKLGVRPEFNQLTRLSSLPNNIKSQMNQVAKDLGFGGLNESVTSNSTKSTLLRQMAYEDEEDLDEEQFNEKLKEEMSGKKLMLVWNHFDPSDMNLIYDNDFSRLESYMSTEDDIICENEGAVEPGIFLLAHNDESEMISFVGHSIEDVKTKFIQAVEQAKVEAQEYEDEDLNLGDPFYYCTDNLNLSSEEMFNEWINWITSSQVDGDSGYAWHLIDVANKQVLYGSEESEVIFYDSVDEYFNDLTGGMTNEEDLDEGLFDKKKIGVFNKHSGQGPSIAILDPKKEDEFIKKITGINPYNYEVCEYTEKNGKVVKGKPVDKYNKIMLDREKEAQEFVAKKKAQQAEKEKEELKKQPHWTRDPKTGAKIYRPIVDAEDALDAQMNEDLQENTITNTLPVSIDQFLMDCAQMYCNFDYTDISKFGERATEDEIKLLRKIRADLKDGFDEDDPEVKDIFNEIEKIVKGTGLTEATGQRGRYEVETQDNSQNQVVESVLMEKDPNLTDSQKKYVEDMYNKDMEFYGFASYDSEDDFVEDVTIDFDELEAIEMYKYYKQLHEVNGTDESLNGDLVEETELDESSNSNIISDLAKELRVNGPRSRQDRKPEPVPGCINEINIPDEMRYKEYDFREENGALYIKWITQGSFTSEDVNIFIDEVAAAIDFVADSLDFAEEFEAVIEVTSRDGKECGYAKERLRFEPKGTDSEQIEEAKSNNSLSARLKARLNKLTECNSEDQLTEEKLSTRLIRRLNQGKINEASIVEEVTDVDLTEESLKWNMGSDKLVSTDSEEFARLVDLAKLLQEKSPNGFMYTVEKTYEDFGAGMQWYNIICHNKKGDRWQVLNTKQWLELANGKLTVEQSYDSIIKDEYFQDKISGDVNTMNHSQLLKFMDSFDEE